MCRRGRKRSENWKSEFELRGRGRGTMTQTSTYELKTSLQARIFANLHNRMPTLMRSISMARSNPTKLSILHCRTALELFPGCLISL